MAKRRRTPPPRAAACEPGAATAEWLVVIAVPFVTWLVWHGHAPHRHNAGVTGRVGATM